jgi:hypothetical protein
VNSRQWRTVSPIDYPLMFNLFVVDQLPIGRGKLVGRNWSRGLDTLLGGWTVSFTTHYQSGDAMTVTDTNGTPTPTGDPYTTGSMESRLGDKIDPKTNLPLNPYFSPTPWIHVANNSVPAQPPLWSWLRGPAQWIETATLSKTVSISERWKVDLRAQAISPFNHPIFSDPSTNLASPATFGMITSTISGSTRSITFGAKVRF